jgi:ActR/RegA family two-component response regulator
MNPTNKSDLLDDLARRLRSVRLEALPDVYDAIERASRPSRGTAQGAAADLEQFAKRVVELPIEGSRLDAAHRAIIAHAFATCEGNISATARLLGMERKALERKLAKYRLKR